MNRARQAEITQEIMEVVAGAEGAAARPPDWRTTCQLQRSSEPETETAENVGRIEEIQGVVIEAVFPDKLPEINHAITIAPARGGARRGGRGHRRRARRVVLVCEVQQHLGDDRVRAVAMDTTDGLSRGTEVIDTGAPITVPVGRVTLGRIFNLLGEPIDLGEPLARRHRALADPPRGADASRR